ncbi:glycosyltransferase [bacterium]|nr:glycosyltransferase [bacterium]
MKKVVSVVIPTFNEEENIKPITEAIIEEIEKNLPEYDYEILIMDNDSTDNTRPLIREICENNKKIKAIFNEKNVGTENSAYFGLLQSTGDCTVLTFADFQEPVEMIHKMVREWEKGYKVITAIKSKSKENFFVRSFRTICYKVIKKISSTEIIEHFTGFGCYDRSFLDTLRKIDDPIPFVRGLIAEFSSNRLEITYEQQERRAGKSHIKFFTLYDMAMRSITSYTKLGLRLASFLGYIVAFFSLIIGIVYLILKLLHWYDFGFGIPVIIIGMFFLGAVQLIFLGLIGEYIFTINRRLMKRPLVVIKEKINFEDKIIEE